MAVERRWLFTQEELSRSPSRLGGIDADKELNYRQQTANFIQDMGQRLQVTQLCINTAIVYMHRFYVFHSFTKFTRQSMAAACLFLAAKVEEQPRKLEHVIKVASMCLHREWPAMDPKSEAYLQMAQDLVVNENILLQTLGFDIQVDHPHTTVVKTCQLVRASKDLAQTSYFLATNSLHLTTMSLMHRPTVVACVCVHLACKWSSWEIPRSSEGKEWFYYTDKDVTLDLLEKLTQEFLDVLDKCPSKLKKKIMTWKSGKRDEELTKEATPGGTHATSSSSSSSKSIKVEPSATVTSASAGGSSGDHKDMKATHTGSSRNDKAHPSMQNAMDSMRRVKTEPSSLNALSHKEYLERKQREKEKMPHQQREQREQHHHHQKESKPDRHHLDALMQQQQQQKDPSKQHVKPHHRPEGSHRHHGDQRRPDPKQHRSHTDIFRHAPSGGADVNVKQEPGAKSSHGQYEKSRDSHRTQPNLIKQQKSLATAAAAAADNVSSLGFKMEPLPTPEVLMAELTKPEKPLSQEVAQPSQVKPRPQKPEMTLKPRPTELDTSKQRPTEQIPAEPKTPQLDISSDMPLKSPPLTSPVKANPVVKLEPLVQAVKEGDPIKKKLESGSVDRRLSINMSQLRERYQSESEKSSPGSNGSPPTPIKTSATSTALTNSPLKLKLTLNPESKDRDRKESKSERKEKEKIRLKIKNLVGSPGVASVAPDDASQARSSPSEGLKVKLDLKRKEVRPASSATSTPTSSSGADDAYRLNQSANPLKIKISKSSSTPPNPEHHHRHQHKSHKSHKSHKHRDRDREKSSHSNGSSHRKRSHSPAVASNSIPHKLQRTEPPVNGSSDAPDVNKLMHQLQRVIEERAAAIAKQGGQPPLPAAPPAPPPPPPPYPPMT